MGYDLAKAQFEKDMAAFLENGGEKSKGARALRNERKAEKEGKAKKVRDADAPKKPAGGAYGLFLADRREEIKTSLPKDHKITDVTKKAGELWNALPAADRQKYEEMYRTAKEKYDAEMTEYKEQKKTNEPAEKEPDQVTSSKRKAATDQSPTTAKRGRRVATPMASHQSGVQLSEEVLSKARTAGYESQLQNLAMRPEVVSSGKSAEALLKALEDSNGLVNAAKRLLCGD